MRIFSRFRSGQALPENSISDASSGEHPSPDPEDPIAGDRGVPSINRARSIQSQVSSVLAITLMSAMGLGFLAWYYTKILHRPAQAQQAAQTAVRNRAQGEMPLPRIPHVDPPFAHSVATPPTGSSEARPPTPAASPQAPPSAPADSLSRPENFLGPQPPPPAGVNVGWGAAPPPQSTVPATAQKSRGEIALERRLAGPAFAHTASGGGTTAPALVPTSEGIEMGAYAGAHGRSVDEAADSSAGMNSLLRPTITPTVAASVLPTRRFLLSKGTFIDCTLETAIDSTLPGMTTCVTATDTFSTDGSVVLLERGTKLVGETRGQVAQGTARIFVLWSEARTPTGVVVPLASPGTDELGRSGLPGDVNRHFWDRFGAAILLTVINGVVQGAVNSQNNGGSVVVTPSTSTDVMTEVLKGTLNIPPTVSKAQGDRIQVFVARDVDFRPVYALRAASALDVTTGAKSPERTP